MLFHCFNNSPWVWPTCFVTNQVVSMLALAFTTPESPIRRITMLLTILSAGLFSHTISNFAPGYAEFRGASMCFTIVFLLNNNDVLNLSKMSYEKHVAWKKSRAVSGKRDDDSQEKQKTKEEASVEGLVWERLQWGASMCWNFRRIGTQHQISNINRFSEKDPSYVPSRKQFLLRTAFLLALADCSLKFGRWAFNPSAETLYFLTKPYLRFFPRLFSVSLPEAAFRVKQVMTFWTLCGMGQFYCYELGALVMVGLGLQDPEQWPPYFGYASKTWSVRQFWGSTWHQSFRQFLTTNGNWAVCSILQFPSGFVSRYSRLMLSFLLSGLIHLAMEYQHGFKKGEAGSVNFFVIQALGIMLEDVVQAIAQKCFPKMDSRVKTWIGYLWVMAFLLETTPVWYASQLLYLKTEAGANLVYPNLENVGGRFAAPLRSNFSIFGSTVNL